jgi:hypothetical protein
MILMNSEIEEESLPFLKKNQHVILGEEKVEDFLVIGNSV